VNGSKQKEHQESEQQQKTFETATESGAFWFAPCARVSAKWLARLRARFRPIKIRTAYSFRLIQRKGQLGKPLTNNGRRWSGGSKGRGRSNIRETIEDVVNRGNHETHAHLDDDLNFGLTRAAPVPPPPRQEPPLRNDS
jgi:hypothetical protein